mmetsp:Transcript_23641/g.64333  ORF Transcript_23641/g.64333 Transcript_23641/m.64333 type:complete len:298 (-) Transcript_23641:244-1137(-)
MVAAKLRHVYFVGLEVLSQVLLVQADGGHHEARHLLGAVRLQLHLLGVGLLLRHPLKVLHRLLRVFRTPRCACGQPHSLQAGSAAGGHEALDNLLSVDGPHAWERWGHHLLLEHLLVFKVKLHTALGHVQDVLQQALGHLPGVLMRVLLCAGQAVDAAFAAVGVLLCGLYEDLPIHLLCVQPQQDDVDHPHKLLVLRGIQHEASSASLDLIRQLLEGPRVANAKLGDVDVVVLQHPADDLRRAVHRAAVLRRLAYALYARNLRGLHLRLVPPLESERATGVPIVDGEPLGEEVRARL